MEGDSFVPNDLTHSLNNLDLYLMPAASNDLSQAIAKSISPVMSVEHIFFNIPTAGDYKLVVYNNPTGGIGDLQNYALAWWFGDAPPLFPPGDYNKNGSVGPEDYDVWRQNSEPPTPMQTEMKTASLTLPTTYYGARISPPPAAALTLRQCRSRVVYYYLPQRLYVSDGLGYAVPFASSNSFFK